MTVDSDTVLDALADSLSIEKAAHRYDLTRAEVRRLVKEATERCCDGAALREAWMLEERRLLALEMRFWQRSMEDGNAADAMIAAKTSERHVVLAGANMPQAHVLQISPVQPSVESSTDSIRDAIDSVMHISRRERELRNKRQHEEPMTDEERAELRELTRARKAAAQA
jgi:hypothetical protein